MPVVLGAGARLFDPFDTTKPLQPTEARPLGAGLAYLRFTGAIGR